MEALGRNTRLEQLLGDCNVHTQAVYMNVAAHLTKAFLGLQLTLLFFS